MIELFVLRNIYFEYWIILFSQRIIYTLIIMDQLNLTQLKSTLPTLGLREKLDLELATAASLNKMEFEKKMVEPLESSDQEGIDEAGCSPRGNPLDRQLAAMNIFIPEDTTKYEVVDVQLDVCRTYGSDQSDSSEEVGSQATLGLSSSYVSSETVSLMYDLKGRGAKNSLVVETVCGGLFVLPLLNQGDVVIVCGCLREHKNTKRSYNHIKRCSFSDEAFLKFSPIAEANLSARSDERRKLRDHFINGRWASLAKNPVNRIHKATTGMVSRTYEWQGKPFVVYYSYHDDFTQSVMKKYQRYEVNAQALLDININHTWLPDSIVTLMEPRNGTSYLEDFAITSAFISIARANTVVDALLALATVLPYIPRLYAKFWDLILKYGGSFGSLRSAQAESDTTDDSSSGLGHYANVGYAALAAYFVNGLEGVANILPEIPELPKMPSMRTAMTTVQFARMLWDDILPRVWTSLTGTPFPGSDLLASSEEYQTLYTAVMEFEAADLIDKALTSRVVCEQVLDFQTRYHVILEKAARVKNQQFTLAINILGHKIRPWAKIVADAGHSIRSTRMQPVVIKLWGDPGVGKSALTPFLAAGIMRGKVKLYDGENFESTIYRRASGVPHWNGYRGQTTVVFDDFGQLVDSATSPNTDFLELIYAANETPWNVPMADLSEKAKTFFRGELCILSSNTENHAVRSLTCPAALDRRITLNVRVLRNRAPLESQTQLTGLDLTCYDFEVSEIGHHTTSRLPKKMLKFGELVDLARTHYDRNASGASKLTAMVNRRFRGGPDPTDPDTPADPIRAQGFWDFIPGVLVPACVGRPYFVYCRDPLELNQIAIINGVLPRSVEANLTPVEGGQMFTWTTTLTESEASALRNQNLTVTPRFKEPHILDTMLRPLWERVKHVTSGITGGVMGVIKWCSDIAAEVDAGMEEIFGRQLAITIKCMWGVTLFFHTLNGLTYLVCKFAPITVEPPTPELQATEEQIIPHVESNEMANTVTKTFSRSRNRAKRNKPNAEGIVDPNAVEIADLVRANTLSVRGPNTGKQLGFAFVVSGRVCVLPRHVWEAAMDGGELNLTTAKGEKLNYPKEDLVYMTNQEDLACVQLPTTFQSMRDLSKHLISDDQLKFTRCFSNMVFPTANATFEATLSSENLTYTAGQFKQVQVELKDYITYRANTHSGDCGAVLLHQVPSIPAKVYGIHVAGSPNGWGFARFLTIEDYELISAFPQVEGAIDELSAFEHIGPAQAIFQPTKTVIQRSSLTGLFPVQTRPAVLRAFQHEEVTYDPLIIGVKRYAPRGIVHDFTQYREQVYSYIAQPGPATILSNEEAAQGLAHIALEPISRSKSAGYPWCLTPHKGKHHWLGRDQTWLFHKDLATAVADMEQLGMNSKSLGTVFVDCLKDERVKLAKANRSDPLRIKTRVFSISAMDFTIVCRKFLGSFAGNLIHNRIGNTMTTGINPFSAEWTQLGRYITSVGDNVYDGDWSAFDASLAPGLIREFFELADMWYRDYDPDYDQSHRNMRLAIGEAIACSIHLVRGELYRWNGGLPSGCFATNLIDSICNLVVAVGAMRARGLSSRDVRDNVRMAFHGDDNIFGISTLMSQRFTPLHLRDFGAEIGMVFTPANKEDATFDWKNLSECQFLKRTFAPYRGLYVCPLSQDTCREMVMWIKKSEDPISQLQLQIETSLSEMAIWNGTMHEEECSLILAARELGYQVCKESLPLMFNRWFGLEDPISAKWGASDEGTANPESVEENVNPTQGMALAWSEMSASKQQTNTTENTITAQADSDPAGGGKASVRTTVVSRSSARAGAPSIERGYRQPMARMFGTTRSTPNQNADTAAMPEIPNSMTDTRIQTVLFKDQVNPAYGMDPYAVDPPAEMLAFSREKFGHEIADILERPLPIPDIDWLQSQTPGTLLWEKDFPKDIFTDLATRVQKLTNFQYFKCDIMVRVAPNAMQFHQGRLLLYWEPLVDIRGNRAGRTDAQYITALKHVEINPNDHSPGMLNVPFVLPISHWNLTTPQYGMGRVRLVVLNSLKTSVSTQKITLSPTYSLTNIEMSMPTSSEMILAQSGDDEKTSAQQSGILSGVPGGVSQIAGSIGQWNVPVISDFAKTVEWVAGFAASLLRYVGLNKPSGYTGPKAVIQTPGFGAPHMDGVSQAIRLAGAVDNELSLYPVFGTDADEMDIRYIVSRPVLVSTVLWSDTVQPGEFLHTCAVFPGASVVDGENYRPTPLAYVASMFKYWTGTINFRIEVVSTSFHAGRLLINYDPISTAPLASATQFGNTWSCVLDISEGKELDFSVPYVGNTPCLANIVDDVNMSRVGTLKPELLQFFTNGAMRITVLSVLAHPDTVSNNVELNIWISGGEDIEFMHPQLNAYVPVFFAPSFPEPNLGLGIPAAPALADGPITAQSMFDGEETHVKRMIEGEDRLSNDQIVPANRLPPLMLGKSVAGEKICNLRQVTKRLSTTAVVELEPNINDSMIALDPTYFGFADAAAETADIIYNLANQTQETFSWLAYVGAMYGGARGGRRYQVEAPQGGLALSISNASVMNEGGSAPSRVNTDSPYVGLQPNGALSGFGSRHSRGPVVSYGYSDLRNVEFEVPQMSRIPFNVITNGGPVRPDYPTYSEKQYVQINNNALTSQYVEIREAAAEDFTLGILVGAPLIRRVAFDRVIRYDSLLYTL